MRSLKTNTKNKHPKIKLIEWPRVKMKGIKKGPMSKAAAKHKTKTFTTLLRGRYFLVIKHNRVEWKTAERWNSRHPRSDVETRPINNF